MYSIVLLVVGALAVVRMPPASCGIVDEQACAKRVHQECKCDLALDSIENKQANVKFCKKLQACADCMAVPKCESVYLDEYRSLLETTLVFINTTRLCPNNTFDNFYEGNSKSCKGSGKVYDHCGNLCDCLNGVYSNCFRVRKEFTQMSFVERRRFVDAYYKATTDRFLRDDILRILNAHAEVPTVFLHSTSFIFLPWHRWFLLQVENFLRQIDCRVTIPYYQWTAPGKNRWRTTDPKDVWNGGPQGLGGNGVPPSFCVQDGKFREGHWSLPVIKGGGCLKRNFHKDCNLYNEPQLHRLLRSKSFKHFEEVVRNDLHGKFHNCVGGDMPDNRRAGNTPEVLLHHSFLDKIWDEWQSKGAWFKYQYFTSLNFRMPLADAYPWQYLDNSNLPGSYAVMYKKFKETRHHTKMKQPKKSYRDNEIGEGEFWDEQETLIKGKQTYWREWVENDRNLSGNDGSLSENDGNLSKNDGDLSGNDGNLSENDGDLLGNDRDLSGNDRDLSGNRDLSDVQEAIDYPNVD